MPVTHRRTCHICEANCGGIVTAEGRDILSIKGDPDNALSRGHVCPKAAAIADLQNDPDRLRKPMKRVGDDWQEISWAQAFAEIGEKTRAIIAQDPASTALYIGNPNAHSYGNVLTSRRSQKSAAHEERLFGEHGGPDAASCGEHTAFRPFGLLGGAGGDRTQTMIILGSWWW